MGIEVKLHTADRSKTKSKNKARIDKVRAFDDTIIDVEVGFL